MASFLLGIHLKYTKGHYKLFIGVITPFIGVRYPELSTYKKLFINFRGPITLFITGDKAHVFPPREAESTWRQALAGLQRSLGAGLPDGGEGC